MKHKSWEMASAETNGTLTTHIQISKDYLMTVHVVKSNWTREVIYSEISKIQIQPK